ncbi:MAG: hypothetical protein ACJA1B_000647 [Polaribacter sp.]|jgi:hypothetical protein
MLIHIEIDLISKNQNSKTIYCFGVFYTTKIKFYFNLFLTATSL